MLQIENVKYFSLFTTTRAIPKLMHTILLCERTITDGDAIRMTVEVEPYPQCPILLCYR